MWFFKRKSRQVVPDGRSADTAVEYRQGFSEVEYITQKYSCPTCGSVGDKKKTGHARMARVTPGGWGQVFDLSGVLCTCGCFSTFWMDITSTSSRFLEGLKADGSFWFISGHDPLPWEARELVSSQPDVVIAGTAEASEIGSQRTVASADGDVHSGRSGSASENTGPQPLPTDLKILMAELLSTDAPGSTKIGMQALILLVQGEAAEALKLIERGLNGDNSDPELWVLQGDALSKLGRCAEALPAYLRACTLHPTDGRLNYKAAQALAGAGDHSEAIRYFRAASDACPDDMQIIYAYGVSLVSLGRIDDARTCFGQVVSLKPDNATSWFMKGQTEEAKGLRREALQSYRRYLACTASKDPKFEAFARSRIELLTGRD